MRNLRKVYDKCINMMDQINMDYGVITKITVNTRAKHRWGQCVHRFVGYDDYGTPLYRHEINISSMLLDERIPMSSLENTIIHEILHTCPGCQNHGPNWKKRAAKVNARFGYDIQRTGSSSEMGVTKEINEEYCGPKYIVKCKKCGREVGRLRMCSIIKHPVLWKCGVCGGDFERIK